MKLKPCPFCGGKAYLPRLYHFGQVDETEYCAIKIGCSNCLFAIGKTIYSHDVNKIIKKSKKLALKWNKCSDEHYKQLEAVGHLDGGRK